jgi:hypothetical protein
MIDYRTEWRTFGDKEKEGKEENVRVGGAINPLLTGGGLTTSLSKGETCSFFFLFLFLFSTLHDLALFTRTYLSDPPFRLKN